MGFNQLTDLCVCLSIYIKEEVETTDTDPSVQYTHAGLRE